MTAVNLPGFLLARIAEAEAPTWTLTPYACAPGCCAPAGWVGSQCRYCDPSPVYGGTVEAITRIAESHAETVHQRSRVVAECEAKRRIVEWYRESCDTDLSIAREPANYGHHIGLLHALEAIALPYADHPDYDEAWRP